MNIIFTSIFILSGVVLIFKDPNLLLSSLTAGANKATLLFVSLVVIYSVWSGVLELAERSGLNEKLAKLTRPAIRLLFGKTDDKIEEFISVNLSANLLGMSGVATPSAIKATKLMIESGNNDGAALLLVIASTSIQLLPTAVIGLRQKANSAYPADILLPTLVSTILSTIIGITLCKLTARKRR